MYYRYIIIVMAIVTSYASYQVEPNQEVKIFISNLEDSCKYCKWGHVFKEFQVIYMPSLESLMHIIFL